MKQFKVLIICLGILFAGQLTFAQSPRANDPNNPPTANDYRIAQKRQEMDKINGRNQNGNFIRH